METKDWTRLGQAIRARRRQLNLSQVDVSTAGGPSSETLRLLERGDPGPYMQRTVTALERVLRWRAGAVQAIVAGESPDEWVEPPEPEQHSAPASSARDRAVTALLDYAAELDKPAQTEVLAFAQRLIAQSGVNA